MITNSGKQIIGKFLLGQAPEFATHIAAGCGANSLTPTEELTTQEIIDSQNKKTLEFESFRVPILAKGFVKENGIEKIVFKAEMPTDQRYKITEVGFFPAANNSLAGSFDSKNLSTFIPTEVWVLKSTSASAVPTIPFINSDDVLSSNDKDITINDIAAFIDCNAAIFDDVVRKNRNETPRFYNRSLMVTGDSSFIDSTYTISTQNSHVENANLAFNFGQNLPDDEIRLAVALINVNRDDNSTPSAVRVVLEFVNNQPSTNEANAPKARGVMTFDPSVSGRYYVFKKAISAFQEDDGFSWANVNLTRIYVSAVITRTNTVTNIGLNSASVGTVVVSGEHGLSTGMRFNISNIDSPFQYFQGSNFVVTSATSDTITFNHNVSASVPFTASVPSGTITYLGGSPNHNIILDGMRFENISTENPLYSLVGYDILKEENGWPVVKAENSTNFIEYRFGIGVDIG